MSRTARNHDRRAPEAALKMRVATYNINNVRKRLGPLRAWLDVTSPDVVCLQELKCTTAAFPYEEVRAMGYEALVHGQTSWNGVAILARSMPIEVRRGDHHRQEQPSLALWLMKALSLSESTPSMANGNSPATCSKAPTISICSRILIATHSVHPVAMSVMVSV
ncbi:hypothetical protein RCH10_004707 [Variovorax sp. GrIS 2.14]